MIRRSSHVWSPALKTFEGTTLIFPSLLKTTCLLWSSLAVTMQTRLVSPTLALYVREELILQAGTPSPGSLSISISPGLLSPPTVHPVLG